MFGHHLCKTLGPTGKSTAMAQDMNFVTFGMFIIDEIEFTADQKPQQNLIGGAGTYAALGARLAATSTNAKTVSWIVDVGSDFPPSFKDLIDSWNTSCIFRHDTTRLTTRAWNGYGPNEHRSFKYLTPKIRLEVSSLTDNQALSRSFHMVCSPDRCKELSTSLRIRRKALDPNAPDPIIIWEPIPDLCTPAELKKLQATAREVSIVSPNSDELAQFFGPKAQLSQLEMVVQLMGWDFNRDALSTHVVVREGAQGSTIYFAPGNQETVRRGIQSMSLSAYHDESMAAQVVDPTGGGNTYLGALAMAMALNVSFKADRANTLETILPANTDGSVFPDEWRSVFRAAVNATVAASYAIEQCGTPLVTAESADDTHSASDLWNGESFHTRIERYLAREEGKLVSGIRKLG